MDRPDVLMVFPVLPYVRAKLSERFTVHCLWEAEDEDALIARIGPELRVIVGGLNGRVPASLMERCPKLEIISNFGVGYDRIDIAWAAERGIIITHTPDVLNEEVADIALALLLATLREVPRADRYLRAGAWVDEPYPLSRGTLRNRKVGILGLGRIGKAIAERLVPFGVSLAYSGRTRQSAMPYTFHETALSLAQACDTLIIVAPLTPETKHIVNAEVLKALGPDGVVINVARGALIDQTALIAALKDGTILAAGLDVYDNEPNVPADLMALENTVLLPHIASASEPTRRAMGDLAIANIHAWFDGLPPLTPVPETPFPETLQRRRTPIAR